MKVSILTLNTWALPVALPQLRRRRRVVEMRDAIRGIAPDIVLLQELFHPPSRRALLDGLAPDLRPGPTAGDTRSSWGLAWDRTGGLVSATRFEIVSERFHVHELMPTMRPDERLARKGILVSTVRMQGREAVLVNVHVCAGHRRRDVVSRRRQNAALLERLRELDGAAPVIVAGDFNERSRMPGTSGENGAASLAALGFRDLWADLGRAPQPTYDIARNRYGRSWFNATPVPAPFDRVLVRDGRDTTILTHEARVVFDGPDTLLSDHFGLVSVLELGPPASAERDRAVAECPGPAQP